jgi:hypothetical protein
VGDFTQVTITNEITMSWQFGADFIRFKFDCKVDGYCSLGWGNKKMYPVDMVAIYRSGTGAGIGDYWSPDYNAPRSDTSSGGTQDYVLESSSYTGGILSATFTRKLNTGDSNDFVFQ